MQREEKLSRICETRRLNAIISILLGKKLSDFRGNEERLLLPLLCVGDTLIFFYDKNKKMVR